MTTCGFVFELFLQVCKVNKYSPTDDAQGNLGDTICTQHIVILLINPLTQIFLNHHLNAINSIQLLHIERPNVHFQYSDAHHIDFA